ncbi:MAG TPA: hypothetical protein PK876_11025 [Elusimicrobiota bacterium]|nr:hypothetical protein [Elusimicrobiota bacterium]
MKICPRCCSENDDSHDYCDHCGDSFSEASPFVRWPRYEALERLSNGYRFLSQMILLAGGLLAVGVFLYFLGRNALVAVFFSGGTILGCYLLWVMLRALSEFLKLLMNMEDHLRGINEGLRRPRKSSGEKD